VALALLLFTGAGGQAQKPQTVRVRVLASYHPDGVTATGRRIRQHPRGIAADPRVFPMGTVLYVPGYGRAEVDDIGRAIKGKVIDIRLPDRQAVRRWGVKVLEVRVLSRPQRSP
jgi:3D (Asp-Asp-Asp) domain-containing protein